MNENEPSLFSHLNEIRDIETEDGGLTIILYAGKATSENDLKPALVAHRQCVEYEVNEEGSNLTGLIMGQGTSIIHLLEGPSDAILRVVRNLASHNHFSKNSDNTEPIQSGRIIYCVEDRPERVFPEWYSFTAAERKSANEDVSADVVNEVVHDTVNGILEVGKTLQTTDHEDVQMSKFGDQLPGKNLILNFSNSEEFFTLQDFSSLYTDPYNVEVDSAWPLESLVQY